MSEKENSNSIGSMLKLGLILALYAVVSCVLLAVVNNFTSPVIEQNNIKKANEGMKVVCKEADSFEKVLDYETPDGETIMVPSLYLVKKNGNVTGAVATVTGPTYDHAKILVGIDLNQIITGVHFLELTDSPGFGLKAADSTFTLPSGKTFYGQFTGKNAADGFTAGETFDAISGASITSKGVANLIQTGAVVAGNYLAKNYGGVSVKGGVPVTEEIKLFTLEDAIIDINKDYSPYEEITFNNSIDITPKETLIVSDKTNLNKMLLSSVYILNNSEGKANEACGVISGQTYGENGGTILVVVNTERKIVGARILSLEDSPNLGMNAALPSFYTQFTNKSVDQDLRNGTDYDAVTGASITSDCIADMIKAAGYKVAEYLVSYGGKKAPDGSSDYLLNNHFLEE